MRRKIATSLLSIFALFSIGALFATWHVAYTSRELGNLVDLHEVEAMRRGLLISVHTVQEDLYTERTALARKLDQIVANVEAMDEAAEECLDCHHPRDVKQRIEELNRLIDEYQAALSYFITASADRRRIDRLRLEAADLGSRVLRKTEGMSAEASLRLAELTGDAMSRINHVRIILFGTLFLTLSLSIALAIYLLRSVTRPVERLVDATRIIASGRLGHRVDEEHDHDTEFGELARHFNAMSAALEEGYHGLEAANAELQREMAERKQAEQERQALQDQLFQARKLEALGTLSAGIAHEFNNLLQVVQGCADSLMARTASDRPEHRDLEMISETVQRGADLTRRLLVVGRKAESRSERVDVNERIRHVAKLLERTLPGGIAIELRLDERVPAVWADPAQIEQVLLNLALNARDAMPGGGRIRFETEPACGPSEADGPTPGQGGQAAVVRVCDTGVGIDGETLDHVFDPFFTTKEVGVGTGLGLATVYGIVTGFGGRIECRSEVGRGSVFEIRLPAHSEADQPAGPARATRA